MPLLLLLLVAPSFASVTYNFTYRALKDDTDLQTPCEKLKYGYANLTLVFEDDSSLSGVITGFVNETSSGMRWILNVTGTYGSAKSSSSDFSTTWLKMEATGPVQGLTWVYKYVATSMPIWPQYSSPAQQKHTFVGTVVRVVGHGAAPAGETASWYAVQQ